MATLNEHHLAHLRHGLSLLAIGLAGKPIAPVAAPARPVGANAVAVTPAAHAAGARRAKAKPGPSRSAAGYFAALPWQDGASAAAVDGSEASSGGQTILELGAAQAMHSARAAASGGPRSGSFFAALPWQQAVG